MLFRSPLWAAAGFLVANGWAAYFSVPRENLSLEPMLSTLLRITLPIANVGLHHAISVNSAMVANVATYALIGLAVETLRSRSNHSTESNRFSQ